MTRCENLRLIGEYRLKVALLGPEESFKSAFQDRGSTVKLSDRNKQIIGVTLGALKVETTQISPHRATDVHISPWDLNCSDRFCMFCTQYYTGSGAILFLLDDHTLDQAGPYCTEILQHNSPISIWLVVLYEGENPPEIAQRLNTPALSQFDRVDLQRPHDAIS